VHPAAVHVFVVQGLASSGQSALFGVPTQTPPAHVSPSVHATPSLHGTVLFTCVHPTPGVQASLVQAFVSAHGVLSGVLTHVPVTQASEVQGIPSLHGRRSLF
jgi:hypothetical protein